MTCAATGRVRVTSRAHRSCTSSATSGNRWAAPIEQGWCGFGKLARLAKLAQALRDKFDETDRRAVVSAVEKQLNVRLKRVNRRRKWFRDEAGRNYWILGGYGEWHGIPDNMMQDEVGASSNGFIAVATRQRAAIEIHIGSLSSIVQGRASLYRAHSAPRNLAGAGPHSKRGIVRETTAKAHGS